MLKVAVDDFECKAVPVPAFLDLASRICKLNREHRDEGNEQREKGEGLDADLTKSMENSDGNPSNRRT